MKVLIIVDMQNDFVYGPLGTSEAKAIIRNIREKLRRAYNSPNEKIIYTRDTHFDDYLNTLEGKKLPVKHCIEDTEGWEIIPEIKLERELYINKLTFGYDGWEKVLTKIAKKYEEIDEIELCGVCTDICVISNALILRALYPNLKITVDSAACAGTTPEAHEAALTVLKSCQIDVL